MVDVNRLQKSTDVVHFVWLLCWGRPAGHGKSHIVRDSAMGPQRGNNESFLTRQTALWISGLYFVFSSTYIYVSGWLVLQLYSDPADLARVEMYKGWGFILSSSVLLFVVIHLASKALKRSTARQFEAAQQYQRMIETTNEGVWKVDANARTMFINQTMADMLGVGVKVDLRIRFLARAELPGQERRCEQQERRQQEEDEDPHGRY
jgi:PAS domain-containing protein